MTDKDRLIKLFKKIEYTPFPEMTLKSNLGNQFTDYALNYIVDKFLANGVIVNEWISVEDGLPEIDENSKGKYGSKKSVRVICACKQRDGKTFAKEGYYELRADGDIFWRIPGTIDSVTHWRPLPELPKEIME